MNEICILYVLTKRSLTMYGIRKFIHLYFGSHNLTGHGAIHPALKKLLSLDYINVQNVYSEGGKKSNYYTITDKGKKYLKELLLSDFSLNPSLYFNEILIRISASNYLKQQDKEILTTKIRELTELHIADGQKRLKEYFIEDSQKISIALSVDFANTILHNLGKI